MAETLSQDTANATSKLHNVQARTEAIQEALEELYQKDKLIKAAIAEHVQDYREDKSAIKKRMREDYQITAKVINARYASYQLQRHAEEADDETTLDVLRELFEALPIGGQLNFDDAERSAAE